MVPYVALAEGLSGIAITPFICAMIFLVGIFHTGFAYVMYFGSMEKLKAQTIALFSYIDPIFAILLSAILLKESMSIVEGIGAVLILCATIVSELADSK